MRQVDGCRLYSVKGGSWLACDGINGLCLIHRVVCIAGKPAPTEKQSSAVLAVELGQIVGAGLLAKAVGQSAYVPLNHRIRGQARSHIWSSVHQIEVCG